MVSELKPWRYEIKYGPDGEDAYSWVYDDHGAMVATMKTHKAKQIVDAMNTPVAPVSPDVTGKCGELVTVGYQCSSDGFEWCETLIPNAREQHGCKIRDVVTRSQAVELLAAERAENDELNSLLGISEFTIGNKNAIIQRLERKIEEVRLSSEGKDNEILRIQADNAALTARIKELTIVLDQQLGTPCEQIAHSEEVKALETKLAAARKDAATWKANFKALNSKYAERAALEAQP